MNRVWLVIEENEYGNSVALACGNPDLAEKVRSLFQSYSDKGEGEAEASSLGQTFYGTYTVRERIVAERASEVETAWDLSPRCSLPEGWAEELKKQ